MKKNTLIIVLFTLMAQITFSQDTSKQNAEKYLSTKGEVTFTFKVDRPTDIEKHTKDFSIVHYNPKTKIVKAWANEKQFRVFESKNIPFEVPKHENEVDEAVIYDNSLKTKKRNLTSKSQANTLTFPVSSYPTYAQYAQQMQDFEDNYPTLVDKFSIGTTTQGDKELLFVKISDNVSVDEQEPKLMFTSSMHGDEIAGYPMMLSLIDYILTVYSNPGHADHARVKNLVENAEIWINPSANPDGTYHNSPSNTSVTNARRGNANNIDLNRNYPDNVAGPHDDGNAYQVETLAFMALADANHFVISANFHGGTELVNYPFDNAYTSQYTHPDGDWFEHVGVEYATHAQNDSDALGDTTYMTVDEDSNVYPSPGVTHGAEWYRVYGGRQDYMNYYHQCKEITVELSDTKILPESQLANYWLYNRDALLDYLTQGTYGFRGLVKDANTNTPIEATVTIVGHDNYGSHTYSDATDGDYYRPIKAGTYDIRFEAPCYQSFTLTNQTIADYETKILSDVLLTPIAVSPPNNLASSNVSSTTATLSWDSTISNSYDYRYRVVGSPTWTTINTTSLTEVIYGLTPTTQYEAQIRSTCSGNNSSPYSSSTLFTTTALPPCTGPSISSFPYTESWDNGIGDWVQGADDVPGTNYEDWTLNSGTTGSTGTGPNDDFTGGQEYFYTEASNANATTNVGQNVSITLISPCFDLTGYENASFSFYYHMYGNGMGSLDLEVSIDNGSNWTNLETISGQQQTSNGDVWLLHTESLSAYDGQVIKLRFVGNTGSTYESDIAIDQIGLTANTVSLTTWYQDADSDGFGNAAVSQDAVSQPAGYVANNTDCDDTNAAINAPVTYYVDADGDGFGSTTTAELCATSAPAGYSDNNTDCDDGNAAINAPVTYYVDADGDGFGSTTTAELCATSAPAGYSDNNTDCDDGNAAINAPVTYYVDADGDGFGSTTTAELCATSAPAGYADNNTDCDDGNAAINSPITYYVDADGDGFGSTTTAELCATSAPAGYSDNNTDCDDTNAAINSPVTYYVDADGDGFGSTTTAELCATSAPAGYSDNNTDCDDTNAAINSPVTYYVDADGDGFGSTTTAELCATSAPAGYADNNTDCDDGNAAINSPITYYVDADGDGFGSTTTAELCATSAPAGYSDNNTDCDDTDAAINSPVTYYVDADGDGFGSTTTAELCETSAPAGYSDNNTDCDDTNAAINAPVTYYVDADGDGFGSTTTAELCATSAPAGYSDNNTDCDDTDANINPGASEIPGNGKDDDCNAATPDGALDIDHDFNLNNVKITPNPFDNNLSITLPLSYNNSAFKIKIFDLNGRLVHDKQYSSFNGTINVSNLSKLEQAAYLLKIINRETGTTVIKRLIKY